MEQVEYEYVSEALLEEEEYDLADNRVAGDEKDEYRDDQEEEEEEEDFIDEDIYGDDDEPANYSVRAGPKKKKKAPSPGHTKPSSPTTGGAAIVVSPAPPPSTSTSAAAKASKGLQKNGRDYLKPAHLVYQRFKWDPKLSRLLDYCTIGHLDRFDGVLETSYTAFLTIEEDEGIPFHRIRYFKIWDRMVWDRESRLDLLTPGTWEAAVAPYIMATLREQPATEYDFAQQQPGQQQRKKAVILSCGSFCPIHRQHIHMVEMAKKHLEQKRGYEVLAAVLSPTPDATLRRKFWGKDGFLSGQEPNPPGFIHAYDRARLIELAAEGRGWIKADLWAAKHGAPTAKAFSHVREVFNPSAGEAAAAGGPEVEVISIFGADTLKRVRNFKNKTSSMLCVVNRKYDFNAEHLFNEKMKGVPAAAAESNSESAHFIDLVLADDGDYSELDASATLVREAFLGGDSVVEKQVAERLLSPAAWEYIRKRNLLPPRSKMAPAMTLRDLASSVQPGLSIGEEIKWSDLRFMTEDGKEQLQEEAQAKRIGQGIGSAAFAMTYMGRPVAVKVCYHTVNPRESPKRLLKFFFNEIRALRKLDHEHVIKYVGAGATGDKIFVVLELATQGCLAYFLSSSGGYRRFIASPPTVEDPSRGPESEPDYDRAERWQWSARRRWGETHNMAVILKVLSDVAQGMAHVHERGIIHRDLSVDNVLISEEERGGEAEATGGGGTAHATLTAKIADFGVCQVLSEEERYERERGYEELLRVRREQRKGRTSSAAPPVVDGEKSELEGGGDGEEEEEEEEREQQPKEKETDHHHLITVRGNMRLYAPEATEDGRYYSFPADVFMFGMLMYEVLEGRQTYQGSRTNTAIKRKMKGQRPEVSAEYLDRCPAYVDLMKECWAHDPQLRPTFPDIARRLGSLLASYTV